MSVYLPHIAFRERRLSPNGMRVLRSVHLVFAMMWTGCGVAILLVLFLLPADYDSPEVYFKASVLRVIDDFGIIPGAFGCLVTGVIYGFYTPWGFFRQKWLVVKWGAVLFLMFFGIVALGPWINANAELVASDRATAVMRDTFYGNLLMTQIFTPIQAVALFCVIFLSVFKPWRGLPETPRRVVSPEPLIEKREEKIVGYKSSSFFAIGAISAMEDNC